eukprot:jgi/Ulvmu1/9954/UM059_0002.1
MQVSDPRVLQKLLDRTHRQQANANAEAYRMNTQVKEMLSDVCVKLEDMKVNRAPQIGTSRHTRAQAPETGADAEIDQRLLSLQQMKALLTFGKVICGVSVRADPCGCSLRSFDICAVTYCLQRAESASLHI